MREEAIRLVADFYKIPEEDAVNYYNDEIEACVKLLEKSR